MPTARAHGSPVRQWYWGDDMSKFAPVDVIARNMAAAAGSPSWASVTGKPSTFPPEAHDQAIATITGLQAALDGKQPSGSYEASGAAAAAVAAHVAAGDPHPTYLTAAEGSAAFQPLASVLTNTTAAFTTAQETKLAGISGTNTGDQTSVSGNAGSATVLATPRTISITGKATAAGGSFDGSAALALNITAVTLVAGDIPTIAQSQVTSLVSDLAAKQATLVSGTNIKTVNSTSLLGSGDVGVGVTSVGGTGTVNGLTLTGTVTSTGNLTLGGTLSLVSPPAIGGTTPAAGTFTNLTVTTNLYFAQGAPVARNASTTLTIADLLTFIITATSASAVSLTLPTGTLTDAGLPSIANDRAFDWSIINLGSSSGAVTLVAGTGHTIVGNAVTAISTVSLWRTRKTATNTFVTYRIG